jgi:hypothetical protein
MLFVDKILFKADVTNVKGGDFHRIKCEESQLSVFKSRRIPEQIVTFYEFFQELADTIDEKKANKPKKT